MSFHESISLAGTVTVGPKGQVVIPADVREGMDIKPGDKLIALYVGGRKTIAFITEEQAQEFVNKMGEKYSLIKKTIEGTK